MKIQTKVLKDIYLEGKKVPPEKIVQNTGLTKQQVYNAIHDLDNRRLVKVTRVKGDSLGGYKNVPNDRILIEINDAVLDRIKKVIRRGEEDDVSN